MGKYTDYLIPRGEDMTVERLTRILSTFQTVDLPKINFLKNFYDGKLPFLNDPIYDVDRRPARIPVNHSRLIVNSFEGMIVGKPVTFSGNEGADISKITEIFEYADSDSQFSNLMRNALITGRAFICNYIDIYSHQTLTVFDSAEVIPVYSDDIEHELLYCIRFWQDNSQGFLENEIKYIVEVYGPNGRNDYYTSNCGFNSFTYERSDNNYFGQCQISVFSLNKDEEGIFAPVTDLINAYSEIYSADVTNIQDFSDAFLVIKGAIATSDDLSNMKKNRCILLSGEGTEDVSYLTKNASDASITDALDITEDKIYDLTSTPRFNDETFGNASSGIALQHRLLSFQNVCAGIKNQLTKTLKRVIENICAILKITDEEEIFGIDIIFTDNLPVDISSIVTTVSALRGLVPRRLLLAQIPFVTDVDEALRLLDEEEKALDIYSGWEDHDEEEEVDNGTENS